MSSMVSKSTFGRNLTSIIALTLLAGLSIPTGQAEAGSLKARGGTAQLGLKSNGGGTSHDFQCGSETTEACGDKFAAKCKRAGGTLSGVLPFGGQNCSTPGGW